jgi:hypothetical protein
MAVAIIMVEFILKVMMLWNKIIVALITDEAEQTSYSSSLIDIWRHFFLCLIPYDLARFLIMSQSLLSGNWPCLAKPRKNM